MIRSGRKLDLKNTTNDLQRPNNKKYLYTKVKVKVRTLDIAPLRGTPPQKRSGTDHTVLPANFTVPASTS